MAISGVKSFSQQLHILYNNRMVLLVPSTAVDLAVLNQHYNRSASGEH